MTTQPSVPPGDAEFELSRSTVFPLVGGRTTWSQEHLLPILATVVATLALVAVFNPQATGKDETTVAWQVYAVIGLYIAFVVNYYVHQLCGRPKRLWVMAAVAFCTFVLLQTPLWALWYGFFYTVIPAAQWQKSADAAVKLAGFLFGTGLCEESFKALPLFALALLGAALAWPSRHGKGRLSRILAAIGRHVGLNEPLDGIVLGAASGSGFFLIETLGEYVPGIMTSAKYPGSQAFDGLVTLLARGLPDLVEHSAWAGLFGYFIGLAALRPRMAIVLLPLGWLSAAMLHGAWDGITAVTDSGAVVLGVWLFLGLFSYALLGGAIFKAREISVARAAASQRAQGAIASAVPALAAASTARSDAWD